MIPDTIRQRFLLQSVPIRLGGLAADLARVASAAEIPAIDAVSSLLEESKAFIEWSAPSLPVEHATRLVEIQLGLAYWQFRWDQIIYDPAECKRLTVQAQAWSDEILAMSGLLESE